MTKDEQIKNDIVDQLEAAGLSKTADINIDVANGAVTLHGMVDVLAEKWMAGELARQVSGVTGVDNSLTVAMDRPVTDAQIYTAVEERFRRHPLLDLHDIEIGVHDGVVYLEGNVASLAQANTALESAAKVYGVKNVVNHLKIGAPDLVRDEATLVNNIETALAHNTVVNPGTIRLETENNKVRLSGYVKNPGQVEAVERIVSQVPGVGEIENNLTCDEIQ
ncbi:BON domain-containing protein [Thermincola ferriacetica]